MFKPVLSSSASLVVLSLFALVVSSCSFSRDKGGDAPGSVNTSGINRSFLDASGNPVVPAGEYPGFNTVKSLIFTPYCAECHMNGNSSGNVSLDTYGGAKANLQAIYQAVVIDHSMPQGGSLSSAGQGFVKAWVEAGGPEADKITNTPLPAPTFSPPAGVDPTFFDSQGNLLLTNGKYPGYNTLKATVLGERCLNCHYSGNPNIRHHFDNYAETKAAFADIGKAVFQGKYMPVGKPLKADELAFFAAWYEADGPEQDLSVSQIPNPVATPSPLPIPAPLPIDPAYLGANGNIIIPAGRIPGYTSVYSIVLAPNCNGCHSINTGLADVRVDTYELALSNSCEINDAARFGGMPLHGNPLPQDRLAVLQAWIDGGAQRFDSQIPPGQPVPAKAVCKPSPSVGSLPSSH